MGELSDWDGGKSKLILQILDKIKPIPQNAPDEVKEAIDLERQLLVMRAGWNNLSADELREVLQTGRNK